MSNQLRKDRMQKDGDIVFYLLVQVNDTQLYMFERFICVLGIRPGTASIDKIFKELILFTARAA